MKILIATSMLLLGMPKSKGQEILNPCHHVNSKSRKYLRVSSENYANVLTIHDYVYEKYGHLKGFIRDYRGYSKFKTIINSDSCTVLSSSRDTVEFEYQFIPYDFKDDVSVNTFGDTLFIPGIGEDFPYGALNSKSACRIKSIKVNDVLIPYEAFEDLLNPNIFETFHAMQPISAYYSEDKKYIFIYIFGNYLARDRNNELGGISTSYLSKLIIESSGKYTGRIVERGFVLQVFGYPFCPNFITF